MSMWITHVKWFLLFYPCLMFQQKYNITFERMESVRYDNFSVLFVKTHNFKFNRTQAVTNITVRFLKDFNNELKLLIQAYRFASNEYRLFPIRFMYDYCTELKNNKYGLPDFYKCGNFSSCPLKKGLYHICNYIRNATLYPPLIPSGSYKVEIQAIYRDKEVFVLESYATVKYPIV